MDETAGRRAVRSYGKGRVFRRGKVWWVAYCAPRDGRSREFRERGGTSETQARALLEKRLREVANAREGIKPFVGPRERLRIADLIADVLRQHEIERRAGQKSTKSHAKKVEEILGGYRASGITPAVLNRFIETRRGDGVTDTTIDRELEILRRALKLGSERGKVATVPRIPRLVSTHANARQGFFTGGQIGALLEAIEDEDFRDFVEWFSFTGWRVREIGSLEWRSYDQEHQVLRLEPRNAKTRRGRVVPVVGPLADILERRKKRRVLTCRLIFHRQGDPLAGLDRGGLQEWCYGQWWRAVKAAGLPGLEASREERLIPYDLRRTAIRNLRAAGVPERVAMEISGHVTRSTFDRYGIVDTTETAAAIEAVRNLRFGQKIGFGAVVEMTKPHGKRGKR
ncbi:MAG: tyrosine-type recombinase/integrase [Acidobacteria bacterium]|nr:tyrosine-type recombinase/integrase [Acidobacteriota bacterium]